MITTTDDYPIIRELAASIMQWPISRTLQEVGERFLGKEGQIVETTEPGFGDRPICPYVGAPGGTGERWDPLHRIEHAWMVHERAMETMGAVYVREINDGVVFWNPAAIASRFICMAAIRACRAVATEKGRP